MTRQLAPLPPSLAAAVMLAAAADEAAQLTPPSEPQPADELAACGCYADDPGCPHRCCRCCEAAAERGELDHPLGTCPYPPCDYHQGDLR